MGKKQTGIKITFEGYGGKVTSIEADCSRIAFLDDILTELLHEAGYLDDDQKVAFIFDHQAKVLHYT